jgi:hypothetical protein
MTLLDSVCYFVYFSDHTVICIIKDNALFVLTCLLGSAPLVTILRFVSIQFNRLSNSRSAFSSGVTENGRVGAL